MVPLPERPSNSRPSLLTLSQSFLACAPIVLIAPIGFSRMVFPSNREKTTDVPGVPQGRGIAKRPIPAKETRANRLRREKIEREGGGGGGAASTGRGWAKAPERAVANRAPLRPAQPKPMFPKTRVVSAPKPVIQKPEVRRVTKKEPVVAPEEFVEDSAAKASFMVGTGIATTVGRPSGARRQSLFARQSIIGHSAQRHSAVSRIPLMGRMSETTHSTLASIGANPFRAHAAPVRNAVPAVAAEAPPPPPKITLTPSTSPPVEPDQSRLRAKAAERAARAGLVSPSSPNLDIPATSSSSSKKKKRSRHSNVSHYTDMLRNKRRSELEALAEALKGLLGSAPNSSTSEEEATAVINAAGVTPAHNKHVSFAEQLVEDSPNAVSSSSSITRTPAAASYSGRLSIVKEQSCSPSSTPGSNADPTAVFAFTRTSGDATTFVDDNATDASDDTTLASPPASETFVRVTRSSVSGGESPGQLGPRAGIAEDDEATGPLVVESTMLNESQPTLLLQRQANLRNNYPPLDFSPIEPAPRKGRKPAASPRPKASTIFPVLPKPATPKIHVHTSPVPVFPKNEEADNCGGRGVGRRTDSKSPARLRASSKSPGRAVTPSEDMKGTPAKSLRKSNRSIVSDALTPAIRRSERLSRLMPPGLEEEADTDSESAAELIVRRSPRVPKTPERFCFL